MGIFCFLEAKIKTISFKPFIFIFLALGILLSLMTLILISDIKSKDQKESEYNNYVTTSEQFDLACSNQETITFELKMRVYHQAERVNLEIRDAKSHKGKLNELFYNDLFFEAPEIILGKLKWLFVNI